MKEIYLDNAATTPIDERVLDAMLPYLKDQFGNASSVHGFGRETKVLLEDARDSVAAFLGSKPSELYFTSGGTESNNFALKGIAFAHLGKRNHIITDMIEHSAVIDSLEYIKNRFGFKVTYLNTSKLGEIDPDELKDAITAETFLISIMHSNNELGIINDIKGISEIAHERGIVLHTDSVQSIGKTPFNVNELNCNTATISAHKIYGPKGIGAVYIKHSTPIDKYIHGGKQERDRRGGTENIAAIAGLKKAIEILKTEMAADIEKYRLLNQKLIGLLKENFGDKVIINSADGIKSLSNIVNITFNPAKTNLDPETLLINLDLKGIAVSSGSACASGSVQPSHVLKAIGFDDNMAKASLRISFGRFNEESDAVNLVNALIEIIN